MGCVGQLKKNELNVFPPGPKSATFTLFKWKNHVSACTYSSMESYTSFETGFIQVMENLESVEFKHFILQAWKVMEFNCWSWKVVEN